jgi:uncharacterized coiled-coil protein SlyX
MNRLLLIWNIVITLAVFGAILSGCASIDPQFAALEARVDYNRDAIETLIDAMNENRQFISTQSQQLATIEAAVNANMQAQATSLRQWVQDYVEQQVP